MISRIDINEKKITFSLISKIFIFKLLIIAEMCICMWVDIHSFIYQIFMSNGILIEKQRKGSCPLGRLRSNDNEHTKYPDIIF